MIKIKLIDKVDVKNQDPKNPLFKKYFMHGTSHHIGLDVHDVGNFYVDLKPGNVFTVEPGIYISSSMDVDDKWKGIGVRIEDNILVTKDGNENLTKKVPSDPNEIESLMS